MDKERFPKIEVMPTRQEVLDRVVSAGLWIGRLFTKDKGYEVDLFDQGDWSPVQQDASQWMDKFDLQGDVNKGWTGGRWDSEGSYYDGE